MRTSVMRLVGLMLVLALIVALAACTTPGKITVAPLWASKLTVDEYRAARRIELALIRYASGTEVMLPGLVVTSVEKRGYYHQGVITLPRLVLAPGYERVGHVFVAHEAAHYFFEDARNCLVGNRAPCEKNANYYAVGVLVKGFGYEESEAIRMIHAWLRHGVQNEKPSAGHEDLCAELRDFEARASLPLSACLAQG